MHSAYTEAARTRRGILRDRWAEPGWSPTKVTRRDATRMVWHGLILGAAGWGALSVVQLRTSLPLMLIVGVAAVTAARAVAATRPLPGPEPGPLASAMAPAPDRPFAGVANWQDRLSWGQQDHGRFESGVRPGLVRIADERLLQRHAITRATHPERARQLMGERLWNLATEPPPAGSRPRSVPMTLSDLVADLEGI